MLVWLVSPLEICFDVAHEANDMAIERSEMSTNVSLVNWNSGFGHWIITSMLLFMVGLRCAVHILGEEKRQSLTPIRALRK
jgi:hypothetical protein